MKSYSKYFEEAPENKHARVQLLNKFLDQVDPDLRTRFETLRTFLLGLGSDVEMLLLKKYIAFIRPANFACIEIRAQSNSLVVYLKSNLQNIPVGTDFARDVSEVGHYGTGNVELTIRNDDDLEKAKPLLRESYRATKNARKAGNRDNHPLKKSS